MTTVSPPASTLPIEAEAPTPKSSIWIFCPEEPDMIYFGAGRKLVFANGRVGQRQNHLSDAEVGHFARIHQQAITAGVKPRFIVTDNLRSAELKLLLWERALEVCGSKAWASQYVKIRNDAQLYLSQMLADDSGPADVVDMGQVRPTGMLPALPSLNAELDQLQGINRQQLDREAMDGSRSLTEAEELALAKAEDANQAPIDADAVRESLAQIAAQEQSRAESTGVPPPSNPFGKQD